MALVEIENITRNYQMGEIQVQALRNITLIFDSLKIKYQQNQALMVLKNSLALPATITRL